MDNNTSILESKIETNEVYSCEFSKFNLKKSFELEFVISEKVPSLFITTYSGNLDYVNQNRNNKETGSCVSVNQNGTVAIEGDLNYIKGRGNSTWLFFDKRPYKLAFKEPVALLDMTEAYEWAMLSNSMDHTLLRNTIALELANVLEIPYTAENQWAHVYENGNYIGIYLICKNQEINEYSINLLENASNEQVYYLEYAINNGNDENNIRFNDVEGSSKNWSKSGKISIKYPSQEYLKSEEKKKIELEINKLNEYILHQDWENISKIINLESFVDNFIVNEIMLSGDMGYAFGMYKDIEGKWNLGPAWDFDQSAGNSTFGGTSFSGWYAKTGCENIWYTNLIQIDEFENLVKTRWTEKYADIVEKIHMIKELYSQYGKDVENNFIRWNAIGKDYWRAPDEIIELTTYTENFNYLFTWLDNRVEWMNRELITHENHLEETKDEKYIEPVIDGDQSFIQTKEFRAVFSAALFFIILIVILCFYVGRIKKMHLQKDR